VVLPSAKAEEDWRWNIVADFTLLLSVSKWQTPRDPIYVSQHDWYGHTDNVNTSHASA
jgi:hypothetical protein